MAKKKKIITADDMYDDYLKQNEDMYNEMLKEGIDITQISDVNIDDVKHWISSGSFLLDASITNCAIGKDNKLKMGIAGGKIAYISGEESTGKSIMAAHFLKNAQEQNAFCVYIDGEQAVNRKLFTDIGVDFSKERLVYTECNVVEKNFELIEKVVEKIGNSKYPDRLGLIVWDSIASTTTIDELESKYGDKSYGHLAKQMSLGFRKTIRMINKYNVAILFTNQLRENMNKRGIYDEPFIEPGGKAVHFYSSLSLRLLKPNKSERILNSKGQQIGAPIKIRFKKNRYGPPQNDLNFSLYYGRGIDDDANLYHWLKEKKFLTTRTPNSTLKLPTNDELNDFKFETKNWKRMLSENDGILRNKIRDFMLKEIKINLNDDNFYDSDDEVENVEELLSEELIDNINSAE